MKRTALAVTFAVVVSLIVAWHAWAQQAENAGEIKFDTPSDHFLEWQASKKANGRFQLFQGQALIVGKSGKAESDNVFKIDTLTGQSWLLVMTWDDDGKYRQFWSPISNN